MEVYSEDPPNLPDLEVLHNKRAKTNNFSDRQRMCCSMSHSWTIRHDSWSLHALVHTLCSRVHACYNNPWVTYSIAQSKPVLQVKFDSAPLLIDEQVRVLGGFTVRVSGRRARGVAQAASRVPLSTGSMSLGSCGVTGDGDWSPRRRLPVVERWSGGTSARELQRPLLR